MFSHCDKLYNQTILFDMSVLDLLDMLPTDHTTDMVPSIDETRKTIQHLRNNAPGESGLTVQMFKSITKDNRCLNYLHTIIAEIRNSLTHLTQWDVGRIVIIPKKSNLHQPGNYRGIMLLEVTYKIIAIIIHKRLQPLIENINHESQCGFRQ